MEDLGKLIEAVRESAARNRSAGMPLGLTTAQAAPLLGRKKKTLLNWSSAGDGPISPVRCHGRLLWPLSGIEKLLQGGA